MNKILEITIVIGGALILPWACQSPRPGHNPERPNILFAISDDQSYPHASVYGSAMVRTPVFDELAAEGVLFRNAFAAAPQCSPSRAAILTGRNIWQLEEAGTHGSLFPKKFPVFTGALEAHGYHVGYTGKAWGPGNWQEAGWERNPVGPAYNSRTLDSLPYRGLSNIDYSGNFREFLTKRDKGQPFFFWFGAKEPHRGYERGSGVRSGKDSGMADVPDFLPDNAVIRHDLLDYALEVEWFDRQLGEMVSFLKTIGEYENTIIVVTSDNGMPFPYAKANLQEWGTHVPLLIAGVAGVPRGKSEGSLVSLIDLAPTFLDLAGIPVMEGVTGRSLLPLLNDPRYAKSGHRDYVLTGRERHTHARPDNLGYPGRAIRTEKYLYIKNYAPDRWPAGDPPPEGRDTGLDNADFKPIGEGYNDIDGSPSKTWMITHREQNSDLFKAAFLKRPPGQLYAIENDPYCIHDLAGNPAYDSVARRLNTLLVGDLKAQGDPRELSSGDIFEAYPRFGRMRNFPGFKERGEYNRAFSGEDLQ